MLSATVLIWYWPLNFQVVRNAIPSTPDSILTSVTPLNSQAVRSAILSVADFLLASFWPIWTLRKCVLPFHVLLIQYWSRFDQFKYSGSAQYHSICFWFDTDLVSINLNYQAVRNVILSAANSTLTSLTPLNSQLVCNAILSTPNSILTSFQSISTHRQCVVPLCLLVIWYWPLFDQFELPGSASCSFICC